MTHNFLSQKKDYKEPSVFKPENLLREARRQKSIPECEIPAICLLDPDGDIVEYLKKRGRASVNHCWAGYHTTMYQFELDGKTIGIIGRAVGASFAVLLAEQMFVSGCELLISITSAGTIISPKGGQRFILIEEALRDEGTSFHYLPPDKPAQINPKLLMKLKDLESDSDISMGTGKSWTTDAPYRETQSAINHAEQQKVTAVEMEAAALYAFSRSRNNKVVCFAHLTNTMAREGEDFEKGEEGGSIASLELVKKVISKLVSES